MEKRKDFTAMLFQINPDILDDKYESYSSSNDLYNLIGRQAKGSEEIRGQEPKFEKKINQVSVRNNQKRIDSQTVSIQSLRDRIEELEIESLIQNQNIKNLQQDLNKLKANTIKRIINEIKCDVKGHENLKNDLKNLKSSQSTYIGSAPSSSSPLQISSIYQKDRGSIPKLAQQIQQSITSENISLRNLRYLKHQFSNDLLIQYTKSDHFNSLSEKIKRLINLLIYESLSEEFQQKDVKLSQKLNEYIERGVILELPKGYDSYREYSKSMMFKKLNKILKDRIIKLIQIEKKLNTGKN
ncbi:3744_t:CDS:1 [Funneliformis geosporum]|uniref:820_t:CDS:1 n=1 Tax=Funneliformis geosporum TaxID=1117311 RepID=A0A9W4SE01_9GLOM|nr:3744_t:CDS:1 [Funneliformis geosporum]CAI2165480.1 820_t:CDS:1 [Funneliformis geosporum]